MQNRGLLFKKIFIFSLLIVFSLAWSKEEKIKLAYSKKDDINVFAQGTKDTWCSSSVTIEFVGRDKTYYEGDDFHALLSKVTNLVKSTCKPVSSLLAIAKNNGKTVNSFLLSADNNWSLKPKTKPAEKIVEKAIEIDTVKPVEEVATKPDEKAATKAVEKVAEQPIEKVKPKTIRQRLKHWSTVSDYIYLLNQLDSDDYIDSGVSAKDWSDRLMYVLYAQKSCKEYANARDEFSKLKAEAAIQDDLAANKAIFEARLKQEPTSFYYNQVVTLSDYDQEKGLFNISFDSSFRADSLRVCYRYANDLSNPYLDNVDGNNKVTYPIEIKDIVEAKNFLEKTNRRRLYLDIEVQFVDAVMVKIRYRNGKTPRIKFKVIAVDAYFDENKNKLAYQISSQELDRINKERIAAKKAKEEELRALQEKKRKAEEAEVRAILEKERKRKAEQKKQKIRESIPRVRRSLFDEALEAQLVYDFDFNKIFVDLLWGNDVGTNTSKLDSLLKSAINCSVSNKDDDEYQSKPLLNKICRRARFNYMVIHTTGEATKLDYPSSTFEIKLSDELEANSPRLRQQDAIKEKIAPFDDLFNLDAFDIYDDTEVDDIESDTWYILRYGGVYALLPETADDYIHFQLVTEVNALIKCQEDECAELNLNDEERMKLIDDKLQDRLASEEKGGDDEE